MTVQANGPEGKAAEGFFGSGSPSFTVRGSDNAGSGITPGQYSADTWYILRYVFNLDAKTIDASMTNEKTGETKAAYEMPLGTSVITTFLIYSEHYDGKWYYDYFNVKKINSDLKDYLDSIGGIKKQTIKKGVEATIVDGPANRALKNKLNIKLDGKYMYPFDEIISKNDVRYISARSLAYMISGSYTPSDEKCVIRYKDKMLELKANTDKALIDSESKSLSAKSIENDGKIYLPLEDSFTLFGYGYEFSNEANEAVVTTIDSAE